MTLVEVETGELVAIPRPSEVVDVYDLCTRVEMAIPNVEDIAEATDVKAKLAAIDAYLAQTSKDGRARLAGVMRRLEVRIGALIGDAKETRGARTDLSVATDKSPLSKHERVDFRQMAAHPEIVEKVIAAATDAEPASRRKVVQAIREQTKQEEQSVAAPTMPHKSQEAVLNRIATARRMAAEGYTSTQIASAIGISPTSMAAYRSRHGIEVPADAVVGKQPAIDSNRIINATVESVMHVDSGMSHIDYAALDGALMQGWIDSLKTAISSLTNLMNSIKKEQSSRG